MKTLLLYIILPLSLLGIVTSLYFLFRNEWIHKQRVNWINNKYKTFKQNNYQGKPPDYDSLPGYKYQLYKKWWIWDFNKLL